MVTVALEIDKTIALGVTNSAPIQDTFFGANYLLGRDSLAGTFAAKIADLGVTLLRYPGGGIAEKQFDINNPDNVPADQVGTFDGLSSFLTTCAELNIVPVVVIPTKKYVGDLDQGKYDITNFIYRLNSGEFGNCDDLILEIGNEYYVNNSSEVPALTALQYGNIAAEFSGIITSVATFNPKVSIQTGKTLEDNLNIIEEFVGVGALNNIDILVYHDYFWTGESVLERSLGKWDQIKQWQDMGVTVDVFVSEWNVGSSNDSAQDSSHDYGLAQAAAMVEFVSEAVRVGVDFASVWAVQQNNKTSLTEDEGNSTVNFGGEIFRMMSESLIGKQALELPNDVFNSELVNFHAFESVTETVIFVSATDFDETQNHLSLNLNLANIGDGFSHIWAERLTTNSDPNSWHSQAITEIFAPEIVSDPEFVLSIDLTTDYELIKIVLTKADTTSNGLLLEGYETDDFFFGGAGTDTVFGLGGEDEIHGLEMRDLISGGAGSDFLFGESGRDKLGGGNGDDTIYGGAQGDRLMGNANNDRLFGGEGNDKLVGGTGDDVLSGGSGADVFIFRTKHGADTISDFEVGLDQLLFRQVDQDLVDQSISDTGLSISYDGGSVELVGLSNFLSESDFVWA